MPQTYNRAGTSTRQMAEQRRRRGIWTGLIAIFILLVITLLLFNQKQWGIGGIVAFGLLLLVKFISDLSTRLMNKQHRLMKRAARGARGEEKVGDLLNQLNDDYIVLHDVACEYGNIDHVVISKNNGIFLLETKAHGGRAEVVENSILINGHAPEKNFLSQTIRNTYWMRDTIKSVTGQSPWITPVLVFTNAFVPGSKPAKGVTVLNKKYLLEFLQQPRGRSGNHEKIWNMRDSILKALGQQ